MLDAQTILLKENHTTIRSDICLEHDDEQLFAIASALVAVASVIELANAQSAGAWAQCGGQGFTGPTTCVQGYTCKFSNEWYSQCVPGNKCTLSFPTTELSVVSTHRQAIYPQLGSSQPSFHRWKESINVNGKNRQYILRVPQNYNPNTGYKFIFALHWLSGTMNDAASIEGGFYGLQALAKESAIFVAPDGLNRGWGNASGEDVKLMDAIMDKIESNLCVDTTQRYATGFSYGAGMSYALACARADKFRGVAFQLPSGQPMGIYDSVLPIASGRALVTTSCYNQVHTKTVYTCKAGYPVWYYGHNGGHVADPKDPGQSFSWAPAEVWSFISQFS
ncbi:hypothetical protein AC1031_015093 [Aphanomyces cochlioides]|nr:hypothetical protein AC1031_015093 [Aphanomyces cochlioides]